jgi:hypothetical protein
MRRGRMSGLSSLMSVGEPVAAILRSIWFAASGRCLMDNRSTRRMKLDFQRRSERCEQR